MPLSLSKAGIFPHKPTWIHKPMRGKERHIHVSKSPELIGRETPPLSPQKSPQVLDKKKSPGIPTYNHIKKSLREALKEVDRLNGIIDSLKFGKQEEKVEETDQTDEFVTPQAKAQKIEEEEIKPEPEATTTGGAGEIAPTLDDESVELIKGVLKATLTALLKGGMMFHKIGRNGKIYSRVVRWSKDMKSVEWFKAHKETPRYILMNSINNASVSVEQNQICTLTSDHRTLALVLETSAQRTWTEITARVVECRSVSAYVDSIIH